MAGDDYNNLFSPDYWSPEGYARRQADKKKSSQKVANYQDTARQNEWGAIGDFIGGIGKFFANAGTDPNIGSNARDDSPFQRSSTSAESARNLNQVQRDSGRQSTAPIPFEGMFSPRQRDPLEDLLDLIGQQYEGSPMDTSFLDTALNSQLESVNNARNMAQENWATSDKNLEGMHNAFKNEILGQAPKIQEQSAKYQGDLNAIFDKTLQENNERAAANKEADMEMFQRLGIAPAARQEDLVGQAIEAGNNRTQESRDSRLAEAATIGNSELERNTSAANAVGAAGVQRRSDLNMRLQEILGELGGKEADIRSNYAMAQNESRQNQEQRDYERFLNERDWNMNRYQQEMDYRLKQSEAANGNTLSGYSGLQATTNPAIESAIVDLISTEPNIDIRNPNQILTKLNTDKYRQKYGALSKEDIFAWLAQYNNLGSTNKFPVG